MSRARYYRRHKGDGITSCPECHAPIVGQLNTRTESHVAQSMKRVYGGPTRPSQKPDHPHCVDCCLLLTEQMNQRHGYGV